MIRLHCLFHATMLYLFVILTHCSTIRHRTGSNIAKIPTEVRAKYFGWIGRLDLNEYGRTWINMSCLDE